MTDHDFSRASGPTQYHAYRNGPRITKIETSIPNEMMPGLMMLRIHTDAKSAEGIPVIGHGETYYLPQAAAAVIHDWMLQRLLGADATTIESHWRFLFGRCMAFGGTGAELRALSAIDLALWDILGQLLDQPVWKLLGGCLRDAVPVYNSCGGPFYGAKQSKDQSFAGWPGHGDSGQPGSLEDNWSSINAPGDLAEELLDQGYGAMKLWAFDSVYRRQGGDSISREDLEEGLAPFRAIRERVGDRIEVMLDGHGFFSLPAALRIAEGMREIKPLWMEDVLRPDSISAMADFRSKAGVPIAVSEMLVTREQYRQALEQQAADYIMIDPTWVGGISETRRIAELAQIYSVPVLMHDCTGPFTLLSGLNIAASVSGVVWQETVRAHIATLYPSLIDENVEVKDGKIALSHRPGIGARWLEARFQTDHPGYRCSTI
ncbi:MAG: mandelate racemase/muconate lactonizing enzyme family protein [Planctomycetaceae bacterium]|jgi:galactonate dehydratase|nr:mandelate racemase/muconate lactonizing enzyme family protein [Planctomycetaceae bacterium]MDG2390070.1 mandelate racemase/muconate lactonizing enzyme family protein [Planctomycetaceae bacterium]